MSVHGFSKRTWFAAGVFVGGGLAVLTLVNVTLVNVPELRFLGGLTRAQLCEATHKHTWGHVVTYDDGGTTWSDGARCLAPLHASRTSTQAGKLNGATAWEGLEERLRSLDSTLDHAIRTVDGDLGIWGGRPLAQTRPNGLFMHSYGGRKARAIWDEVSMETGHQYRTFCEIGVNLGHSAVMWLEAHPEACVYLWDLPDEICYERYMCVAFNYLKYIYKDRVVITQGDHLKNIMGFARKYPGVKCDVIAIDGPKDYHGRKFDLDAFYSLSHNGTLLLLDDSAPEEVVDQDRFPRSKLRGDTDRLYRDYLVAQRLEVVKSMPFDTTLEVRLPGMASTLNHHMGHGTLVARYNRTAMDRRL